MEHRFATNTDLDLLAEWNHHLIGDEGHSNPMGVPELRKRMQIWLRRDYQAIIFLKEAVPVAYALYSEDDSEIYLRQLYVKQNRRREGIGREAIRILRTEVWPRDRRLTVEVLTANRRAIAFWRAVGYTDYSLKLEITPQVQE